ncbi:MAG: PAS domain-containing sensor histidine kinase, partial [Gemmatimonadetes bacterium]|nr:PAS domain-containing sensor histidine kinase [Gemmatimonadota bacterium]
LPMDHPVPAPALGGHAVLGATLAALFDAVAVVDRTGTMLACNDAFLRAQGVERRDHPPQTREEFRGRAELCDADGVPIPFDQLPLARALRGDPSHALPVRIRKLGTNTWRSYRLTATPLMGSDGTVQGAVLVGREDDGAPTVSLDTGVPGQAVGAGAMLPAPAILGALFDTVGDDLLLVDHTGRVLACNDSFLAYHGLRDRAECPAHREGFADLLELFTLEGEPVAPADMPLARALRGERCREVTLRIRHLRRERWSVRRLSASPLRDAQGRLVGALLAACDVTAEHEARRREARMVREVRRLQAPVVAVGGRVMDGAVLAHELRNPLQVLLATLPALALEPLTARQQEVVARLHRASTVLTDTLEGMLTLARTAHEEGHGHAHGEPVSLAALLDAVAELHAPALGAAGVRLALHTPPAPHDVVHAPAEPLRRVLMNLVANAAKFTRQGEVTVRLHVEPLRADGDTPGAAVLHGEVADTGIGIPEAHQGALFAPFAQAHAGQAVSHGGSGLGLAICRELLAQLGGTIALRSREGVGTTVSFTLPVHTGEGSGSPPGAGTGVA